jgi:hypothetical protein
MRILSTDNQQNSIIIYASCGIGRNFFLLQQAAEFDMYIIDSLSVIAFPALKVQSGRKALSDKLVWLLTTTAGGGGHKNCQELRKIHKIMNELKLNSAGQSEKRNLYEV